MRTSARRPSARGVALCGGFALAALGFEVAALWGAWPAAAGTARSVWLAALVVFGGVAALDAAWIRRLPTPRLRRRLPHNLALHAWTPIPVELEIPAALPSPLRVGDRPPPSAQTRGLPLVLAVDRPGVVRAVYDVRPLERGDAGFAPFQLQGSSPLRLWRFTAEAGDAAEVRVYPDFSAVTRFRTLELEHETRLAGGRLRRRRGEGLEFQQLREYRVGDASRQIDWKATSRHQQLIAREYQDERDQRVVFLLDCSRRMRARDDALSHFDHGLNAMVLLAHVALRAGDAVGMLAAAEPPRWLPPRKGVSTVERILDSVYDLEPSTLGMDFRGAAEELCRRQPRRCLVVLLTNVRDEDVEDLAPGIALLRRRHLVMLASLRPEGIDAELGRSVHDFHSALRQLGAWEDACRREASLERLRAGGCLAVDATPSVLHAQLVGGYHAIKRSGAL